MRWSRIGLYTLASIVAVLLVAFVVLISVDLGMFKHRVENLVTDLLDREFRIDGEMHAYLGKNIELYVEDVYLANPEWADEDAFVTAGKIDIVIDAWSLLRGPIEIERVESAAIRVNIEKNDAGDASWTFVGLETEPQVIGVVKEPTLKRQLPLILDFAAINDTQVSYISSAMEVPLLFIAESLQSSLVDDVMRVELSGSLNATPVHFVQETSPIENLLAYENVSIEVSGNIGEIAVRGSAMIDDLLAPRRPRVELSIDGPNASYLTDILSIQPISSGPMALSVSVRESGAEVIASISGEFGEFDFDIDGKFEDIQELKNIDLNFAADGPDIGTIIRLTGREYTESDPFDIHGRISRNGPSVTIENVLVEIGASNMTIEGFFGEFPAVRGGNLSLEASGPDYGRFNRLFGMPGRLGGSFTTSLSMTPSEDGRERVAFAANTADIQVQMDGLVSSADNFVGTTLQLEVTGPDISTVASAAGVDGLEEENFRITAAIEKDADGYVVSSFETRVDDEVLKVTGHIGDQPFLGDTALEFDFSGVNIGESVIALGAPAQNLPKGVFYMKGGAEKRDGKLWLKDVVAVIGDDEEYRFQISGFMNPDEQFAGSQFQVKAYGASLAALAELAGLQNVPDFPFDINADLRRGQSNTYFDKGIFKSGIVVVEFSGQVGDKPLEDDMALTFNATVPRMQDVIAEFGIDVTMMPAGDLVAAGTLRHVAGQISADTFTALLGGATLSVNGDIGLPPSLAGTKLKFELDGDDLSRVIPPGLSRESLAHAFAASGSVSVSGNEMELEGILANVGHTTVAGDFQFSVEPLFKSGSFEIRADSPDLFQLLPKLKEVSVPQLARMKYRGNGSWVDNFWTFDKTRMDLGDGYIEIDGTLDGPPTFERTELDFEWVASSISKLSAIAGRELPDQRLELKGHLVGTQDVMTLEDFVFTLGESDLDGQFTMRAGEIPAVEIDVTSKLFDVTEYLPKAAKEPNAEATAVDNKVIPDTKLPLQLLQTFDADIDINIDELRTPSLRLFGLGLDAFVSDGALEIGDLSFADRKGGSLSMSASLLPNDSDGADFELAAIGKGIVMGVRVKTEEDLQRLPSLQLAAELTANGETVRDLAGSLNGYFQLVGGEGRIPTGSLGFLTQDFLTELIGTINPFTKSDPYTYIECAVVSLQFYDGVIDSDPAFVQQTDKLRIFANTKIDLKTENLDANFKIVPRKGLGISLSNLVNPYVKVTGTLDKPALVLDPKGVLVEGSIAVATAGLSILAKGIKDRYFSAKDPCAKVLADAEKEMEARKRAE